MTADRSGTPRERLIVWLWKHLPVGGNARMFITWAVNLRYAVGVTAIIMNDAGHVLLLRHTYRRGAYEWGLPGGWVKGRERLERALARELREETGFEIAVTRLVAVHSGFLVPRLIVIFAATIIGGAFRPSAEVMDYRYFPPEPLDNVLPGERRAVREALRGDTG